MRCPTGWPSNYGHMGRTGTVWVYQQMHFLPQIRPTTFRGRKNGIKWGRSDLRLDKFRFSDFLDCTDCAEVKNIGGRLSERVFIYNNLLNPGTGYTPQQMIYGISSGIPGIFQIPRHPGALFARSLQRMISGIHYAQKRGAPIPLGDDFPYEPGDQVQLGFNCLQSEQNLENKVI